MTKISFPNNFGTLTREWGAKTFIISLCNSLFAPAYLLYLAVIGGGAV
jgi:hypothetical protein